MERRKQGLEHLSERTVAWVLPRVVSAGVMLAWTPEEAGHAAAVGGVFWAEGPARVRVPRGV